MSVTIRLSLIGKKGQPVYRIVATETRSKRNGKYIDSLGMYDPSRTLPVLTIDEKKLVQWQKNGAIISTGLAKLLKK